MPGFDGTGPRGFGPMTGGGRGFCAVPTAAWRPRHRGFGGWGGYGMRWRSPLYWQQPVASQLSHDEELDILRDEAEAMRAELKRIESRIESVEQNTGTK